MFSAPKTQPAKDIQPKTQPAKVEEKKAETTPKKQQNVMEEEKSTSGQKTQLFEEEKKSEVSRIPTRPQVSALARRKPQGKQIELVTNQFWINFTQDMSVYQYEVEITPDFEDYFLI